MKKRLVIIGGGATALVLAAELDPEKFDLHIYEKNAALGRKFLVAGEGGLNFTHSEKAEEFIKRYSPSEFLMRAFLNHPNLSYMSWMNSLGIEIYTGTSSRVFPKKGNKPIHVLDKIMDKILKNKVNIHYKSVWIGFDTKGLLEFKQGEEILKISADYIIFCLGGASWPVTGSDGSWANYFTAKNITVNDFLPSNCAFEVVWNPDFIKKAEGSSLKNSAFTCGKHTHKGEAVITRFGIEGSGIYPLSPQIRDELALHGQADLYIDLKPQFSLEKILEKLQNTSSKKNISTRLKEDLNMNDIQIALLKTLLRKDEFLNTELLSARIKGLCIKIVASGPLSKAISSTGGLALEEIDENFELKKLKHHFVIGEMLDYDAPTGGYLLQSCYSMAQHVAHHLNSLGKGNGTASESLS